MFYIFASSLFYSQVQKDRSMSVQESLTQPKVYGFLYFLSRVFLESRHKNFGIYLYTSSFIFL